MCVCGPGRLRHQDYQDRLPHLVYLHQQGLDADLRAPCARMPLTNNTRQRTPNTTTCTQKHTHTPKPPPPPVSTTTTTITSNQHDSMTTHHHTSHTDAHTFTSHKAKTQEWHKHKHADDMNTGQQEHTRRSRRRPHHHTTAQNHTNTRTMLTDAKRQHSMHTCRTWHAQQNRPHNTTQHTHNTHTHHNASPS